MHPEQPENPQARSGTSGDSTRPGTRGSGGAAAGGSTPGDGARSGPDRPPAHVEAARPGDDAAGRSLSLVRYLREGCPWDARQTPDSLRPYLLEEAHETADAVLAGDDEALAGELGDLLLNVAFQIVLAEERGAFDAPEVMRRLEEKMVRRHPHVYGDAEEPPDWEEMKARERGAAPGSGDRAPSGTGAGGDRDPEPDPSHAPPEPPAPDPFAGVPSALEPLSRALRVQQRAAALGFDWPGMEGALEKLREEAGEVEERAADRAGSPEGEAGSPGARTADAGGHPGGTVPDAALEEELGDLLFAAVNVVRLASVHPARALESATRKFEDRFRELARRARERGVDLEGASLEEMEAIWQAVKAAEG